MRFFIITFFISVFLSYTQAQKVRVIDNKGTLNFAINNRVAETTTNTTTSPITNPEEGDVWIDSFKNITYIYDADSGTWKRLNLEHKGTEGSVFFAGTDGFPTEKNKQFFWNNTDFKLNLGIKNNAIPPSDRTKLNVFGAVTASYGYKAKKRANQIAYRFLDDANTGMDSPSADNLSLSTGGTEAIRIDNDQRVGIGTTTPTSTLQIEGSVSASIIQTTANITLTEDHHTVVLGGKHNIILPTASTCKGRMYIIKNPNNFSTPLPTITTYKNTVNEFSTVIPNEGVLKLQSNGTDWVQINNQSTSKTVILNRVATPANNNLLPNQNNTYYNIPVNSNHIQSINTDYFEIPPNSDGTVIIKQDGNYLLTAEISTTNMPKGYTKYILAVFKNGNTNPTDIIGYLTRGFFTTQATDWWGTSGVLMHRLQAGDVIKFKYFLTSRGGSLDAKFLNIGVTKL